MNTAVPDNCDGFNVTFMCSSRARDCVHGSCWHMDRVRQMVRMWFLPLVPCRAQTLVERERPEPVPMTKAETKKAADDAHTRAIECRERHSRLYPEAYNTNGSPRHFPSPWRSGIGYTPFPDEDGVGSWGRVVRIVEDAR